MSLSLPSIHNTSSTPNKGDALKFFRSDSRSKDSLNASQSQSQGNLVAVNSATLKEIEDEDIDKIMLRNTRIKGRDIEYYGSEQGVLNMNLKGAVLDNEEALEALQESQIERCAAMRQQLRLGNEKRRQLVSEFDDGYKWCTPAFYSVEDLITDSRLTVSVNQIADLGQPIQIPSLYGLQGHLQTLLTQKPHKGQLELIENELYTLLQILTGGKMQIVPNIVELHEFIHSDVLEYVIKVLQEKEPPINSLITQIDQCESDRQEALRQNSVVLAQEKHVQSLKLMEDLIFLIRERLNEVMLGTSDPEQFKNAFKEFQGKVQGSMDKFKQQKQKLKEDVTSDLAALQGDLEKRKIANEICLQEARKWQEESNRKLMENAHKQDAVWTMVLDNVVQLRRLGEERREEVTLHMEMHEREHERRHKHEEVVLVIQKHMKVIEDCGRHTDCALTLVDLIDKYFREGFDLVSKKKMTEILDELLEKEQEKYYQAVRRYSLCAGELIERKEKRLISLNKMVRNVQQEKEIAPEALDPDTEKYEKQIEDYETKRTQVQKELLVYRENLANALQDFKDTEDMLELRGVDFIPPSLEVQENQAKKKQDFLEMRRMYVEQEQDELAREQKEVGKQEARVKVENEAVRKRAAEKKLLPSKSH